MLWLRHVRFLICQKVEIGQTQKSKNTQMTALRQAAWMVNSDRFENICMNPRIQLVKIQVRAGVRLFSMTVFF